MKRSDQTIRRTMHHRGVGLIEILVVIFMIGVAVPSIWQLLAVTTRVVDKGAKRAEAAYLAQEGLEVVRTLRSQGGGWTSGITTLQLDTALCPTILSGAWSLPATNPCEVDGYYTRSVELEAVYRDNTTSDIVAVGCGNCALDPNTKLVTASVFWNHQGEDQTVVLQTYVTNYAGD